MVIRELAFKRKDFEYGVDFLIASLRWNEGELLTWNKFTTKIAEIRDTYFAQAGKLLAEIIDGNVEGGLDEFHRFYFDIQSLLMDASLDAKRSKVSGISFKEHPVATRAINDIIGHYVKFLVLVPELDSSKDPEYNSLNYEDRMALLERYISTIGLSGFREFHRKLFGDVLCLESAITNRSNSVYTEYGIAHSSTVPRFNDLPRVAPKTWQSNKAAFDSPVEFIKEIYGPWLGKGLTRANIRVLDRPLSSALDNWLRKDDLPEDLDLPTAHEWNTRRLNELKAEPDKPTTMTFSEARRLVDAERKRSQRTRT